MHALAIVNEDQQLAAINGICVWLFIIANKVYVQVYNYIIDAYYNELIVVIQQVAMVVSSYKAR